MNWRFWKRDQVTTSETVEPKVAESVDDPDVAEWAPDYERYKAVCDAIVLVQRCKTILAGEPAMAPWSFLANVLRHLNNEAAKALGEPFKP